MDDSLPEKSRRCVLCAASHSRRCDLRILGPGVFIAEQFVEVVNHGGGFFENPFRIFHVLFIDPVGDGKGSERILDNSERSDSQHEEIGGVGKLLRPVIGFRPFLLILFDTDQPSIGENLVFILNSDDHLIGHFIMGEVIAGKPVVSVFRPGDG